MKRHGTRTVLHMPQCDAPPNPAKGSPLAASSGPAAAAPGTAAQRPRARRGTPLLTRIPRGKRARRQGVSGGTKRAISVNMPLLRLQRARRGNSQGLAQSSPYAGPSASIKVARLRKWHAWCLLGVCHRDWSVADSPIGLPRRCTRRGAQREAVSSQPDIETRSSCALRSSDRF